MFKALDLFCGAGGASEGLRRTGFEVTGVDIRPQPHYRGGTFVQADALEFPLEGYDLIWASPPCQAFTAYKRRQSHVAPCQNLIPAMRARLAGSPALTIIENVSGAPLRQDLVLCGSMFGLDVRRHRLFELSFEIAQLACRHQDQTPRFPPASNRRSLRRTVEVGVWRIPLEVQQAAMGIGWMTREELSQAIPPAYSEHIGRCAIAALDHRPGPP
jgi:DNA (cytosine-5)-methyltransferase 1